MTTSTEILAARLESGWSAQTEAEQWDSLDAVRRYAVPLTAIGAAGDGTGDATAVLTAASAAGHNAFLVPHDADVRFVSNFTSPAGRVFALFVQGKISGSPSFVLDGTMGYVGGSGEIAGAARGGSNGPIEVRSGSCRIGDGLRITFATGSRAHAVTVKPVVSLDRMVIDGLHVNNPLLRRAQ
jgi:hypothetical protein